MPDDLLHRAVGVAVEVRLQEGPLLRVGAQQDQPVSDRVPGGLHTGDEEQREERAELT
ncbi:hypothetical protein OKW18_006300 [Streptomyces pratensis]|nr:hypothetical protein [Streptomyces pratensis]